MMKYKRSNKTLITIMLWIILLVLILIAICILHSQAPSSYHCTSDIPKNFMVFIFDDQHKCGGSIISLNYILTAAHCVNNATIINIAVTDNLYAMANATIELNSSDIIIHENYTMDPEGMPINDIALLKLNDSELNFLDIRPVSIDSSHIISIRKKFEGIGAYVLHSPEDEAQWHNTIVQIFSGTDPTIIHGKENSAEKDIATGSSGGALMVNDTQIGIVSYGNESLTLYTRIDAYCVWITKNTNILAHDE